MSNKVKLCLAGIGLIGQRYVEIITRENHRDIELISIVDPSDAGQTYAKERFAWYPSLKEMFANSNPDGVILATPNQIHLDNGLDCVEAGVPMLIEKPIATTCVEAKKLVDAAQAKEIPILVGHHRRHNQIIQKAYQIIQAGDIGQVTSVHSSSWFLKPAEYFAPEWRRKKGGGPILVNAIHDVDLLRYLCGHIQSVQAMASNAVRGFEIEDTAAAMLRFESGALGTLTMSDTITSPWSWECTSGENPDFAKTPESCYMIGGTKGSLSIPDNRLWRNSGEGHWKSPLTATFCSSHTLDPLVLQIRHFAQVIRGEETPLVSAEEGMKSLAVIEAIKESSLTGQLVTLNHSYKEGGQSQHNQYRAA